LENLPQWWNASMARRAQNALQQLLKLRISKYNHARQPLPELPPLTVGQKRILLVDQTVGDASVAGAGADESSFQRMLQWACASGAQVIIKTHPDVLLGKKQGYLGLCRGENIHVLTDDVCPFALFEQVDEVATVCSQLGFEALLAGKSVHCFAIPFYAQRGLTIEHALPVMRAAASLEQLFAAAYIMYPRYFHPHNTEPCELEDILNWLQAQLQGRSPCVPALAAVDFSLWKRSFIPEFVAASAREIRFVANTQALKQGEWPLMWGLKTEPENTACWRIEDGFIRSVGLGADLRRPSSLVLDDLGIYYDGTRESRLEYLLQHTQLNAYELERTECLINLLRERGTSKYNEVAQGAAPYVLPSQAEGQQIVLVVGQFQQDLSIAYGCRDLRDNLSLLRRVREDFPSAYVIYKEHPDVYSGVRPGRLADADIQQYADLQLTDVALADLFPQINRLCTLCSLSGFEALLRGVPVSTYGIPFYAGWGLTQDACAIPRRKRELDLATLVYCTLVLYPRYIDWCFRRLTTVEILVGQIAGQKAGVLKSSWLARQWRKLGYLWEALFN
ncbi:MAG: capsular polysaccharide biosynthesis protein, partial [Oceanospirillaceae bacterium]|nr:capsular polysaccharide biosynthesis protein [Oceanospirillaceae bacterium]